MSTIRRIGARRLLVTAALIGGCGAATAAAATGASQQKAAPSGAATQVAAAPVSSLANGYQYITDTFANGANQQNFGSVSCPAGRNVVGGGVFGFSGLEQSVNSSFPIDNGDLDAAPNNGWGAWVNNKDAF